MEDEDEEHASQAIWSDFSHRWLTLNNTNTLDFSNPSGGNNGSGVNRVNGSSLVKRKPDIKDLLISYIKVQVEICPNCNLKHETPKLYYK